MSSQDGPVFITFTGADRYSDIMGMIELSDDYPIEWGLLFSPDRQGVEGQTRYPPLGFIHELVSMNMGFAAHLCGGDARAVMDHGKSPHNEFLAANFDRVQINTVKPVDIAALAAWAKELDLRAIVQSRDSQTFPTDDRVEWLFDSSGGRGQAPASWPTTPCAARRFGYAGGLNPINVRSAVNAIASNAGLFYIDMETGVRDSSDRFDLGLCRQVCEAVYGPPKPHKAPWAT